jgi:hypothetical protein
MVPTLRLVVLSCLLVIVGLHTRSADATIVQFKPFERLVLDADFVGVVECEEAGGIVARYKVIESWKGPKAGERVSIRMATNYWGQQFDIALCGERFLMTAYKSPADELVSWSVGGGVPLWWRQIPADYQLPLLQGCWRDDGSPGFAKICKEAGNLIALKPAGQEAALLKGYFEHYVYEHLRIDEDAPEKATLARFAPLTEPEGVVDELVRLARADPEKWGGIARASLANGGGPATLDRLQKLPAGQAPWKDKELTDLIDELKKRLAPPNKQQPVARPPARKEPPTETDLEKWRKALVVGPSDKGFGAACYNLTRHDPGPVVEYLLAWTNPSKEWRDADNGYVLGSEFACLCEKERKKHLTALLGAKDPYIRVAGAVYLCFEDLDTGKAELKKLTALEGDPGVWAALTLASRGDKDAVPRILHVFAALKPEQLAPGIDRPSDHHDNLQKRVLVLLSNSARAGRVPQPPREGVDALTAWWKEHGDKVVLTDPWLKVLEKQKID